MTNNRAPNIINAIDHVEFYVGNALQTALFYQHFWGFDLIAYSGYETHNNETVSYVLKQGDIILVFTAGYHPEHPVAQHVSVHGDSVKKIAFRVNDAKEAYERAIKAGAKSEKPITKIDGNNGILAESAIKVYGDTIHSFIERQNYSGLFMPGFVEKKGTVNVKQIGLTSIDHITANIDSSTMEYWIKFYENAFGFKMLIYFDENDVSTAFSGMSAKVLVSENGSVKLPLIEPINKIRKSQIQEFLDANKGPGIQHLAFNAVNIIDSMHELKDRGIDFLRIPDEYYRTLNERVYGYDKNFDELKKLQVMIEQEDAGFLLQSFTKPILDRPTYFIELIQRKGAVSFGKGNVKALFSALVQEQQKRQNV